MAKQYSFNAEEHKYTTAFPRVSSQVVTDYDLAIYQGRLIEERVQNELSRFLQAKGIKTVRYKSMMKGAGGYDILSWIIEFYHNHQVLFAIVKLLPGLVKMIRSLIIKVLAWHTAASLDLTKNKPQIHIYFRVLMQQDGYTDTMLMQRIKRGMEEFINIVPELEAYMRRKHPEFKITYNIVIRWSGEKNAVALFNYSGQRRILKRIVKKMTKHRKPHTETMTFTVKRNILLRNYRFKLDVNETIL